MNCGGLAHKLPRLVALLIHSDPDIACLQEIGSLRPDDLSGLPYHTWLGPPSRGGGLATLTHRQRLRPVRPAAPHLANLHLLIIQVAVKNQFTITIANMHLPPSLPARVRRAICANAATRLTAAPAGARIICGDLNDTQIPGDSQWLHRTLSPHNLWWGYRSPYPMGTPTNLVPTAHGMSRKEIDWLLISMDTPCVSCEKQLLPGLSTHLCLQCDLFIPAASFVPLDPTGRQFRFQQASDPQLHAASSAIALALWWAQAIGLPPDRAVTLCWAQGRYPPPQCPCLTLLLPDLQCHCKPHSPTPHGGDQYSWLWC